MRYWLAVVFFTVAYPSLGQNQFLDSLYEALENHPARDSLRVSIIFTICWEEYCFRPDKNKNLAEEALEISEEIRFTKGIGDANGGLALYYWATGDYEQATKYAYKMLRMHESIPYLKGIGQSYQLLALINQLEGEFEKSKDLYTKALDIFKKGGHRQEIGSCYNLMGTFYLGFSKIDLALEYFLKSLEIRKETHDENGISQVYGNLGRVYTLKNDYVGALNYFELSLQLMVKLNNRFRLAVIYTGMGDMFIRIGDYDKAKSYFLKSIDVSQSIHQKKKLEETYNKLTLLEKKRGKHEDALLYFELAYTYRDSIYTESKAKQIAEVEARYETAKKDQKIQLLERDKRIRMLWTNILIAALVLLAMMSVGIYYLQAFRERKNRKILDLEIDNLATQHKEISKKYESVILKGNGQSVDSTDQRLLKKALEVVESNMSEATFGVDKMAKEMGMSRTNMHRRIKAITGFPPSELIRTLRLRKAVAILLDQANSVAEVSFMVGFDDQSYFSKAFKKQFGVPPSEYAQVKGQLANPDQFTD